MASDKPITESVVMKILRWPFRKPRNVNELTRVEQAHISIDLYLWLRYGVCLCISAVAAFHATSV